MVRRAASKCTASPGRAPGRAQHPHLSRRVDPPTKHHELCRAPAWRHDGRHAPAGRRAQHAGHAPNAALQVQPRQLQDTCNSRGHERTLDGPCAAARRSMTGVCSNGTQASDSRRCPAPGSRQTARACCPPGRTRGSAPAPCARATARQAPRRLVMGNDVVQGRVQSRCQRTACGGACSSALAGSTSGWPGPGGARPAAQRRARHHQPTLSAPSAAARTHPSSPPPSRHCSMTPRPTPHLEVVARASQVVAVAAAHHPQAAAPHAQRAAEPGLGRRAVCLRQLHLPRLHVDH